MTTVRVLSGLERRRRWSSSEKARTAEESLVPGRVVTAVARLHDVHSNLLHHGGDKRSWLLVAERAAASASRYYRPR